MTALYAKFWAAKKLIYTYHLFQAHLQKKKSVCISWTFTCFCGSSSWFLSCFSLILETNFFVQDQCYSQVPAPVLTSLQSSASITVIITDIPSVSILLCFFKNLQISEHAYQPFLAQGSLFSFTEKDSWCWIIWTNKKLAYCNSVSGSKKVNWR